MVSYQHCKSESDVIAQWFWQIFVPILAHYAPISVAGSVGLDQSQVKPDKYAIHVDCVMSGFRSMRFEHESIAHSSLEFLYEIKFKAGLLTMVIYGCCLNNVLINSVKFNKKQILRHFYGKVAVWIPSQKAR